MKADVVIIGGGLASLVAGIKLQKEGKSVIIVSAGQSALHFSSGSMGLMGRFKNKNVENPLEHIDSLHHDHPYIKVGGKEKVREYLTEARSILEEAGIELKGSFEKNHYKLTPFGVFTPEWLSLKEHLTIGSPDELPWKNISLIGIKGFLDFFPYYLKAGLEKMGAKCNISEINIKEFDTLRQNPTEMRAPNIARTLTKDAIERLAEEINRHAANDEIVLIPAIVGLNDNKPFKQLEESVKIPVYTVSTTPNSVPGIRMQIQLRKYFKKCGGWYLLGDLVTDGYLDTENNVKSLNTANLGNDSLKADHYILATGSFFSRGLKATRDKIIEPVFNADLDFPTNRVDWFDHDVFREQPFMKIGVVTDRDFHCKKDGEIIHNLSAIGGITGGCDPLYEGVGAGVAMSTALHVARRILN